MKIITSQNIVDYLQCKRKVYLQLFSNLDGSINDYEALTNHIRAENQTSYINNLLNTNTDARIFSENQLKEGINILVKAKCLIENFEFDCPILSKSEGKSKFGNYYYEPTIFIGSNSIGKEHRHILNFNAFLLLKIQNKLPTKGRIIDKSGNIHQIKLNSSTKSIYNIISKIQDLQNNFSENEPNIFLCKYCVYCRYQKDCKQEAEKKDCLSLLNRITEKQILKFEKRGIFTVKQLSYIYKPRRRGKNNNKSIFNYRPDLHALALRENKIYIQQLPDIDTKTCKLYLDIESIPDCNFNYLFGLLIVEEGICDYSYFWVNQKSEEETIWKSLITKLDQYQQYSIFHYGNFELSAFERYSKYYQVDIDKLKKRFVNINSFIYGKIYFPSYSNGLKDLGKLLGYNWSEINATGLQSIVWRYNWEKSNDETFKNLLIEYNRDDCYALKLLTNELIKIQKTALVSQDIDFVNKPKKFSTEIGEQTHQGFKSILEFSYLNYDKKKIKFNKNDDVTDNEVKTRIGSKKGFKGQRKVMPKPTKVIIVPKNAFCYLHSTQLLEDTFLESKRLIIDLVFTKNGIRKTVTKYIGKKGYCAICKRTHAPNLIKQFGKSQLYGYNFKAWFVFQRVGMQLPYEKITEIIKEQFDDDTCWTYSNYFIKEFAEIYLKTETIIIERLLKSNFIHADETTINIRGATQYVWVFTNGVYVIFKLSKTRESIVAHEFLKDYKGVLISDFFAGYDNVNCKQQKCWVHFIRDLNNDLWEVPFDKEFETFVLEVKKMISPIIESVYKYGLKKYHLSKFRKEVDIFYKKFIDNIVYKSEFCNLYQKRFIRYRESLFTFIGYDGINWHNNTAESAIRHIAKQRSISGYFHENRTHDYLRLLGIKQTCRFKKKSFLKFLLSKEMDIDKFKSNKRTTTAHM